MERKHRQLYLLAMILGASIYPLLTYGDEYPTASAVTALTAPLDPAATAQNGFDFDKHVTGTFDIVSNYVSRGISQTMNGPAVQGSFTYTFDSGFYVSLWGSNVKFEGNDKAYLEFDPTIGYAKNLTDKLAYNIYLLRYYYPKSTGLDYNELMLNVTYSIFQATVGYSNNIYASNHSAEYYMLGVDYPIPPQYLFNLQGVAVGAAAGRVELPEEAGDSYNHYDLYISKSLSKKVKVKLKYTDTNGNFNYYPYDKAHLFVDLSMTF